jgi:hypothetical protein
MPSPCSPFTLQVRVIDSRGCGVCARLSDDAGLCLSPGDDLASALPRRELGAAVNALPRRKLGEAAGEKALERREVELLPLVTRLSFL